MPVSAGCDWLGQHNTCRVYCLPNVTEIHSPCDLFDEERRQALGTELLVNAQEVDLGTWDELPVFSHLEISWNTSDKADLHRGVDCSRLVRTGEQ